VEIKEELFERVMEGLNYIDFQFEEEYGCSVMIFTNGKVVAFSHDTDAVINPDQFNEIIRVRELFLKEKIICQTETEPAQMEMAQIQDKDKAHVHQHPTEEINESKMSNMQQ